MKILKKKGVPRLVLIMLLILVFCALGYSIFTFGRPAPIPHKETLFDGAVVYRRRVYYMPRMTVAHVLEIDTKAAKMNFLVTPLDNEEGPPLNARTTSAFLDEYGLQIAINGNGFYPWWSRGPLDYYPHSGDPITPNGYAASGREVYALGDGTGPVLYFGRRGGLGFRKPGNVFHAIAGDRYLILGGEKVDDLDDETREPRTAIGFNQNGRRVYMVVVDGRQPFYSAGATFDELADILKAHGAYFGMSLDGGGSSTMVIEGKNGEVRILNSPIDQGIPGRERPVGNHIGVSIR
jgi:hypothetical protein